MNKTLFFVIIFFIYFLNLNANEIGSNTGFKIPRFVSLKHNESNLRVGPSENYPILITYIIENKPVEVIDEYDMWRKIKDYENNIGWLKKNLLKGDRFAIVDPPYNELIQIYNKPKGKVIGKIGKKNIVKLNVCLKKWCKISINNNTGWTTKTNIWGVYDNETLNIPFYQFFLNKLWDLKFL